MSQKVRLLSQSAYIVLLGAVIAVLGFFWKTGDQPQNLTDLFSPSAHADVNDAGGGGNETGDSSCASSTDDGAGSCGGGASSGGSSAEGGGGSASGAGGSADGGGGGSY